MTRRGALSTQRRLLDRSIVRASLREVRFSLFDSLFAGPRDAGHALPVDRRRGLLGALPPGVFVVLALAQLDGVVQQHELPLREARREELRDGQRGVVPERLAQRAPRVLHEPRVALGLQVVPRVHQRGRDVPGEPEQGVVQRGQQRHGVALSRGAGVEIDGEPDAPQLALDAVEVAVQVTRPAPEVGGSDGVRGGHRASGERPTGCRARAGRSGDRAPARRGCSSLFKKMLKKRTPPVCRYQIPTRLS